MNEENKNQNPYPEYKGMTSIELAHEMKRVKEELDKIKSIKTGLEKRHDHLRIALLPEIMENEGLNKFEVDGVGRISLTADIWCSVPATDREKLYKWLDEIGSESLITNTVNASTFKSFVKARMKKGEELPDFIKITPYQRASITKVAEK